MKETLFESSYRRIIPVLQKELDWKSICFEFASKHPNLFEDCYQLVHNDPVRQEVIDVLNGDRANKFRAMKRHREMTRSSLAEALEYVNKLIEELGL